VLSRVAVEKLLRAKFAKIKLRQDALQTTFSIFLDIFYPPINGKEYFRAGVDSVLRKNCEG